MAEKQKVIASLGRMPTLVWKLLAAGPVLGLLLDREHVYQNKAVAPAVITGEKERSHG